MRVNCIGQLHSLSHERNVEPLTGTSGGCHDDLSIPPAAVVGPKLVRRTEASPDHKHRVNKELGRETDNIRHTIGNK
jgi:hypothetical protein